MPTIAALVPANMTHGMPAFVLTVNGTNFSSNATIYWNGTAETHQSRERKPADRDNPRHGH